MPGACQGRPELLTKGGRSVIEDYYLHHDELNCVEADQLKGKECR